MDKLQEKGSQSGSTRSAGETEKLLTFSASIENAETKQKTPSSLREKIAELMDPSINSRFKISNFPTPSLPKFEIQNKKVEQAKSQEKNTEDIPLVYRPPLFDDPPAKGKEEAPKPQEQKNTAKDPAKNPSFEAPKRKELPSELDITLPKLPPLIVPIEPNPQQTKPKAKPNNDWFPMPSFDPSPTPKEPWPRTLTPIEPRDYSGERRNPSDAPQGPRDSTAAAYWRGRSISDPELISKGILEASYVQEVMSRHPDAILIGENGNIRYMKKDGQFTLKTDVPLWLPRAAGLAFLRAQAEASKNGVPIRLEDGPRNYNPAGRTMSQQQSAVRTARIAAPLGSSRHQSGGALDIMNWNNPVVQKALRNAGWQHGDGRGPIANDYHHWSYAGR